ncbi:MAG: insulinase family protein, partial [Desulfovibrionaceae bacterium]
IALRTPPADSTGLPHILEHSVLCGSRKYPVKEPFVELLKGSLQTFLNALTFPDKTCYPVASANEQDFYNLMDVYLDAVFFPRLTPLVLHQEGWHLRRLEDEDRLVFQGVVYNEMKGAYSSPDNLLSRLCQQSILPDTAYGLDSGGDPAEIVDLTFEDFAGFHAERYHPSNAYAFLWGDMDMAPALDKLDEYFSQFDRKEADTSVGLQTAAPEPRNVQEVYASDNPEAKSFAVVNFGLPETIHPEVNLALHVLEHALIGMPSSPLRKTLVESGLGEDLAGVGLEDELRQMYFSVGLKGVAPGNESKAIRLVQDTLAETARDGLHPEVVEAALNTVEFELRENNTGSFPQGLGVAFKALSTWLYDQSPLLLPPFEAPLEDLKQRIGGGENVLEELLQTLFVENEHVTTVTLAPDPGLSARLTQEESERIRRKQQDIEDPEAYRRQIKELDQWQSSPDDPQALAAIPRLRVADLERRGTPIPSESREIAGVPALVHELDAAGVVYLDVGFDLRRLPERLLPYTHLFGRALVEMGTEKLSFEELTRRIAGKTGGLDPQTLVAGALPGAPGGEDFVSWLFLRGKSTQERLPELADILQDVLLNARFTNKRRLASMVLEAKAARERWLTTSGHAAASLRLRAGLTPSGAVSERMAGVENLRFLRSLSKRLETDFDAVAADLEEMRSLLVRKGLSMFNVTTRAQDLDQAVDHASSLAAALPEGSAEPADWSGLDIPAREGLGLPTQVNYVGEAATIPGGVIHRPGAALAAARRVRNSYLWEKIRVTGGAYGAFCMYDYVTRSLLMLSYRDPHMRRTVNAYHAAADFLESDAPSRDELEKAIIGTIGDMDQHMLPDAKGFVSLSRHLTGETDEVRQMLREQALSTTAQDFREFGAAVRQLAESGRLCVLGAKESLASSGLDLEVSEVL